MVEGLGGQLTRASAREDSTAYIAVSTSAPPTDHPRASAVSSPSVTAKNAAKTGSIVMTIAARVAGMCACAHVCTHRARMLAKTTM